jgi:hypothetical protein
MKTITCWRELEPFGIEFLTGEACGLSYRYLCDLTEAGKRIVEKCLSCRITSEAWNRGTAENPHVASILLAPELLPPLSIFALLESGCTEVFVIRDHGILGIESSDDPDTVERTKRHYGDRLGRRYAYHGTAGARNVHQMSGRIE